MQYTERETPPQPPSPCCGPGPCEKGRGGRFGAFLVLWLNFLYLLFRGGSCCTSLPLLNLILRRDGKIGLYWYDGDCLLPASLFYFWSAPVLESIYPWGLFSSSLLPWPNLSSSPAPFRIFCCSLGLYLFIYLRGGAAPWGMTQMFKNRSAGLVRGSHKPSRQWLPRFSSPFRFVLFSLLSGVCLQELRDCSCDFFSFFSPPPLCWAGNSDAWAKELNHISMKKVSSVLAWCLFKTYKLRASLI